MSVLCLFRDFMWSPTDNMIAYWVPEQNEIPTKIIIIQVPSKQEVSTKSRHLVSEVRLINYNSMLNTQVAACTATVRNLFPNHPFVQVCCGI